jgi:hypothetical protein
MSAMDRRAAIARLTDALEHLSRTGVDTNAAE